MSLRFECLKRNYELEDIKHRVTGKRIRIGENPLQIFKEENEDRDSDEEKPKEEEEETITHKLGEADPLADYHKLENLMLSRSEFESWEAKKLKIFA